MLISSAVVECMDVVKGKDGCVVECVDDITHWSPTSCCTGNLEDPWEDGYRQV